MNLWKQLADGFGTLRGSSSAADPCPQLATDLRQTLRAAAAQQSLRPSEQAAILTALRAELAGDAPRPQIYRGARHWVSATLACALTILSLTLRWQVSPMAQATAQALPAAALTSDLVRPLATQVVRSATPSHGTAPASTPVPSLALYSSAALPIPSGTMDIASQQ